MASIWSSIASTRPTKEFAGVAGWSPPSNASKRPRISFMSSAVEPAPPDVVVAPVLTDVVLPRYFPTALPIDKRCVVPDVPDDAVVVAVVDVDGLFVVVTNFAEDGTTRNVPARIGVALVAAPAAAVPSYVPAPPSERTVPAAIALVVKPAHNTHKTDTIEILKVCFFMSLFPRLFYHICESLPNTFLVKIHTECQLI